MRCPKCGYNSFDHLDSCKKCGKDLVEHKQKYGIVSVLFPGQMKSAEPATEVESESVVEEAVAVATATTAAAAAGAATTESTAAVDEAGPAEASEGDDFGFDFMGDSEEEEDLSFDELFEEAPADEDVEETLPSPEQEAAKEDAGEFSFDPEAEEKAGESELESDFGFEPVAAEDALEAEDFELPPAEKEEFSFDSDEVDFSDEEEEDEAEGTKEDPKDPFDLPESSLEGAPEDHIDLVVSEPAPAAGAVEDNEQSLADSFFAPHHPADETLQEAEPVEPADGLAGEPGKPAGEGGLNDSIAEGFPAAAESTGSARVAEPAIAPEALADELPADNEPSLVQAPPLSTEDQAAEPFAVAAALSSGALAAADEDSEQVFAEPAAAGQELLPQTGNRVAAFCCDLLLLVIVGACFVVAAEAAMSPAGDSLLPSLETLIDLSVPYFLVLFSLAFGYFTLFHFLAGQTPGKMLAGLRVETLEGEPLLFSQAFLRSVGGLLQVLPAGLGYFAVLSSPERRGWNDRLAGTRLISLKGVPEEA